MAQAKRTAKVKYKIKKNDMVMVVAGRDRGKTGKVMRVIPERGRVVVERLNMVKRHSKARGAASPGGIVDKEAALDISNVMIFCDRCNAPVRVGVKAAADGAKSRVCRRCGEAIGND
ncbi:MAG: 50S ribosomal protein L24 [Candidatus Binatus sp.]|uniref:50S ribosomal protein L24 n=1 Tax=Candidatus Binatus sp. TaxID=2811406 RepID=UPI002727A2E7|nr:50S ribosomal protein L24 [Candidatus Binatus sp.]MDO8434446.1 50S ribosomal protein L24 [Candidatus Binatus sp.]